MRNLVLISAVSLLATHLSLADEPDWPQFRGPGARGVAPDADRTDTWSTTDHIAWVREIAGRGWSSPIVSGDRVFLTTAVSFGEVEEARKGLYFGGERKERPSAEHVWLVVCLDLASGNVVWEKEVHRGIPEKGLHIKNSYASETPVTDGERVWRPAVCPAGPGTAGLLRRENRRGGLQTATSGRSNGLYKFALGV